MYKHMYVCRLKWRGGREEGSGEDKRKDGEEQKARKREGENEKVVGEREDREGNTIPHTCELVNNMHVYN